MNVTLLTNPLVLILVTIMVYIIIATILLRSIYRSMNNISSDIYIHNVYTSDKDIQYDHEIESAHCHFCNRIDIIHFTTEKLHEICSKSNLEIGEMSIRHDTGETFHNIRYFFDIEGNYLGERIPVRDLRNLIIFDPLPTEPEENNE